MHNVKFVFIDENEATEAFSLIKKRMAWMKEKGIRQWVEGEYEKAFPPSYYHEKAKEGGLVGLKDGDCLLAIASLAKEDGKWNDGKKAIYVHTFASDPKEKGAGSLLLSQIEEYAAKLGFPLLRLDSIKGNETLKSYYQGKGFAYKGEGSQDGYAFLLWEKRLGNRGNENQPLPV